MFLQYTEFCVTITSHILKRTKTQYITLLFNNTTEAEDTPLTTSKDCALWQRTHPSMPQKTVRYTISTPLDLPRAEPRFPFTFAQRPRPPARIIPGECPPGGFAPGPPGLGVFIVGEPARDDIREEQRDEARIAKL